LLCGKETIQQNVGDFVNENGDVLGTFPGISWYTIGQRARIPSQKNKYYVARKDYEKNQMLVVTDPRHPFLLTKSVQIQPHWISLPQGLDFDIKYRYRTPSVSGSMIGNRIHFHEAQQGLCVGQQIALYQGNVCVGGGKILCVE
jgi:tRNA U34 2-thiouridine synthase MnmA/TrmU